MHLRSRFTKSLLVGLGLPLAAGVVLYGVALLDTPSASAGLSQSESAVTPDAVDNAPWSDLLKAHVDDDGFVDYAAIKASPANLDAYLKTLARIDLSGADDDAKLAALINAYNAFMIKQVVDAWPINDVLKDLDDPFKAKRFTLGGEKVSLDQIENEMIRPQFDEPRIHWAVVCGAFSCPKLRNEAYAAETLEEQLADQAKYVHDSARYIDFDGTTLKVTPLYDWYGGDFKKAAGSVLDYLAQQRPDVKRAMGNGTDIKLEFLPYSWDVNDVDNRDKLEAMQ